MDSALRPGFNLEYTFKDHLSNVRLVARNPVSGRFFSADDKTLKTWSSKDGSATIHHSTSFPGYQSTFITAMAVASDTNLLFAACLDGNLRIYNERLTLKSCMPWSNGIVSDLIYNKARKEVITSGSCGIRIWDCDLDHEAYKNAKDLNPFDIPRTRDGQVVPWCFGLYQHARNRLNLSIPSSSKDSKLVWCDKVHLYEKSQIVFGIYEGSIFGYEMEKGTAIYRFQDLHPSAITTMAYLPQHEILVTSSVDSGGTVWRIAGGKPHRYKDLGSSHLTIHHLATDEGETSLLAATGDGVVTLWSVDTLMAVYKMKLPQLAIRPTFFPTSSSGPPHFYLHFDSDVKLFSIQNLYHAWMECNSEPRSLKLLSHGLILASFADSSVRILDQGSTAPDKAAVTTVPQLSTSSLVTASCNLSSGHLYTLLSNGSIHSWDLHLRGPPTFNEAWTHLEREQCTCMEVLDGEAVSDGLARAWGLLMPSAPGAIGSKDHLILGTAAGDVIVLSVQRKGLMVFRFPAYKYQAVEHLSLDYDRDILVTTSKTTCKVWSMATGEVKCKMTVEASADVSRVELLEGRALFGTTSGSLMLLDVKTGRTVTSTSSDHMALVTGIGASIHLQHFVTCSSDRSIKILDRDKVFKRSIYLAQTINCCSFLNDAGDLLIGLGHRLVMVKAELYEFSSSRDEDDDMARSLARKDSIYHHLKGTGGRSLALNRADHSIYRKALSSVELPPYIKSLKVNVIRNLAGGGYHHEEAKVAEVSVTPPMPSIVSSSNLAPPATMPKPAEALAPSPKKLPPILQGSSSLKERASKPQPKVSSTIPWNQVLDQVSLQTLRDKASAVKEEVGESDEEVSDSDSDESAEEDIDPQQEEEGGDDDQESAGEALKVMEEMARAAKIKAALEAYYEASAALAQKRRERRQLLASGQDSSELRGMVETRLLLNLADEASKRDRKMYGAPKHDAEDLKAKLRPPGAGGMKVNELTVEVDEEPELLEPQAPAHAFSPGGGESVGEDMLHSIRLAAEAGQGLSAAFKKVLPVISSSSAFLEVDGAGGELKVKRTKLKRGLKKKKSHSGHGPAKSLNPDGEPKKKKKKKKKRLSRKAILESIDPARALALGQKDHSILQEIKEMELHRMMTKQVALVGNKLKPPPRSQPPEPPGSSALSVDKSREKLGSADGRASLAEPPDPMTLLETLKDGWRASLAFPASATSKLLQKQSKQEAADRGVSLLLGTEELNAVMTSMALKPHISQPRSLGPPIPGLKYNPRIQDDDQKSSRSFTSHQEGNKSRRQLVHVPTKFIEEGMHLDLSRVMSPEDEEVEAGIGRVVSARSLLLGHSDMKSKLMREKSSTGVKKVIQLNTKDTDGGGKLGEGGQIERESSSISIFGRQRNRSGGNEDDHSGLAAARKIKPLMMKSIAARLSTGSSPRKHFASQD